MAISATLELRDNNADGWDKVKGTMLDSYTVIDLDYTLKRSFDKTNRASSGVSMDFIKVTIRGTKELKTPFHEWINDPDMKKGGIIKIFDSAAFFSSTFQDTTGGEAPADFDVAQELASDELEDSLNYRMDEVSYYGTYQNDIFEEMSKEELVSYINSKGLPIKVNQNDTDIVLRQAIRDYNDFCKSLEKKSLQELKNKVNDDNIGSTPDIPEDASEEEQKKIYIEFLKENYKNTKDYADNSKNYTYSARVDQIARRDVDKTLDKLKKSTSKAVSSVGSAAIRSLESARSITFNNAYCVSLREHFKADPNHQGPVDSSYPWILEIGIKPGTVTINGANIGGAVAKVSNELTFKFFNH